MGDIKLFISKIYKKVTISELRLILKIDNTVDLFYNIYNDIDGPTLIWNITKVGKEYKLTRHISSNEIYTHNLVTNCNDEEVPKEKIGTLKEVLAYINFHKAFKISKEIIDSEKIDYKLLIGDSNPKNLPFNKYYLDKNNTFEYYQDKITYWYEDDYFKVFKHALEYLGIKYKQVKHIIIWWYLGQKFETKVNSFGQISYGICYGIYTKAIENHNHCNIMGKVKNLRLHDIRSTSSWILEELINCIITVNIINNVGIYNTIKKVKKFNDFNDISTILVNKKILHSGDPSYVIDKVFDGHKDRKEWIKGSMYLKSKFPNIDKICCMAKESLLDLDPNIISKIKELGIKNVILGYYGFRELYVHPDPYKYSSFNCWRFNDPITIDTETGIITYHHLHNNEKVYYPRIKFNEKELYVEAYQHILVDYVYRIPLEKV